MEVPMSRKIVILSAVIFVMSAVVLIAAGPMVASVPGDRSPYLSAIADLSAPEASAGPRCNFQVCLFEVHNVWVCDQSDLNTLCTVHNGNCSYTTDCTPETKWPWHRGRKPRAAG